jgi:hypothetical protein
MARKILLVEESREPSLHVQLAMMGLAFDSVRETEAVKSASENDYDFVIVEASESGCEIAYTISKLPLSETGVRPHIIGIRPLSRSAAAGSEDLPAGFTDVISRPIRTDVLYESICCAGTSLEPEKSYTISHQKPSDSSYRADTRTETLDNLFSRNRPDAHNATYNHGGRNKAARGWQRGYNHLIADHVSSFRPMHSPLLALPTNLCGFACETPAVVKLDQISLPLSLPLFPHHCHSMPCSQRASNVAAIN